MTDLGELATFAYSSRENETSSHEKGMASLSAQSRPIFQPRELRRDNVGTLYLR
jgi:hypothetical protein